MFSSVISAIDNSGDPRVSNWLYMSNITNIVITCIAYILLVKVIGPAWMESRKPFNLKYPIMAYNFGQVILSMYLTYKLFDKKWLTTSYFECQSVDRSTEHGFEITKSMYYYYLTKYLEFLDTFFFVLRKKNNQITFLHVYHHASMPLWAWGAVKYYAGGTLSLGVLMNSLVHSIMYSYYFLSGLGPEIQKYLWWKRYITMLQLFQFGYGSFHITLGLFRRNNCNISAEFLTLYNLSVLFFLILFSHFYRNVYTKSKKTKKLK